MAKKTEKLVAQAILQREMAVEVGGVTYQVAPPSIATLIMVSELVAEMPAVDTSTDNSIKESLRIGRDCRVTGDILATLILGAKRIRAEREKRAPSRFGRKSGNDPVKELAVELLENKTPSEISELTVQLLKGMEVSSFFSVIAFLSGINILKPTGEAVTTASGR